MIKQELTIALLLCFLFTARCRRAMAGHGYSPREIYDHNGNAHNVTLEPGYMLLFESHSAIHGGY
jgi:hypothetical protein